MSFSKKIWVMILSLLLVLSLGLISACDRESVKITLNDNYDGGASKTVAVKADGTFDLGSDPVRDGFVFDKWYLEAACKTPFTETKADKDITLFAGWIEEVKITITLNYNLPGVQNKEISVAEDGTFDLGAAPTHSGYRFEGWFKDAAGTSPFTDQSVSESATLYAKWTKLSNTFTITYSCNGTDRTEEVEENAIFVVPNCTVEKNNYLFDGKYKSGNVIYTVDQKVQATSDMTLVAVYIRAFQVSFELNGGTGNVPDAAFVKTQSVVTLPDAPTNGEQRFMHWLSSADGNAYRPGEEVTIDSTTVFSAVWHVVANVTVTYDLAGGQIEGYTPAPETHEAFTTIEVLNKTPKKVGHLFVGWYDGINTYQSGDSYELTKNTSFVAKYDVSGVVIFHDNSVMRDEPDIYVDAQLGAKVESIDPEPRKDYSFLGWYQDAGCTRQWVFNINEIETNQTDLYAKWRHNYFNFTALANGKGYYVSGPTRDEVSSGIFNSTILNTLPETLRLPDEYEGKPVVGIFESERSAFQYLMTDAGNAALGESPLHKVIIPASYTRICDNAFYWCNSLEEVEFEDGSKCTSFGMWSFYHTPIRSIKIPNSVTEIGEYAFLYCEKLESLDLSGLNLSVVNQGLAKRCRNLTELKLPQNVVTIKREAFQNCFLLREVNLPSTVTYIGNYAFGNNTADESYYAADGSVWEFYDTYEDENGNLHETWDKTHSQLQRIFIPKSVKWLGDGAFCWAVNASEVVFEGGCPEMTNLGAFAFYGCKSLTSIAIPANIQTLGGYVTRDENGKPNGIEITYERDKDGNILTDSLGSQLIDQMYGYVFRKCSKLEEIVIPAAIDLMMPGMFRECSSLTKVTFLNQNIDFNGSATAFKDCTSLKEFTIPASVTVIGDYTFENCTSLENVVFAEGSKCDGLFPGVFKNCSSLTSVNLPDCMTNIAGEVFFGCTSLTELKLPADLGYLGTHFSLVNKDPKIPYGYVFGDSGITSLELPSKVSYVAPFAMAGMPALETFTMADDGRLSSFYGGFTFLNCTKLSSVTFSGGFGLTFGSPFGEGAFIGCTSLKNLSVSEHSEYMTSVDGVIYSGGTAFEGKARTLLLYPFGRTETSFEVAERIGTDTVSQIYTYAFEYNVNLNQIIFPSTIKRIEAKAFYRAENLKHIVFKENSELNYIGTQAFTLISTFPTDSNGNILISADPIKAPLESITIAATVPPTLALNSKLEDGTIVHPFFGSTENKNFTIYVPEESVEAYKAAEGWSLVAAFIKPISKA